MLLSIIFTIPIWIIVALIPQVGFNATIIETPSIIFAFMSGFLYCDLDNYVDWLPHRSFWTHSVIFAIPLAIAWNWITSGVAVGLFCYLIGLHCAADAWKDPTKQVGYWLISWKKGSRWDKRTSYSWLALNAGFGIFVGLLVMVL